MKKNSIMRNCFRTTKCFGAWSWTVNGEHYNGAFPNGFLKWVKELGYWGDKRVYLCSGTIEDKDAIKVDIRPEVKPDLCEDARHTSLKDNSANWIMIDPPYSRELAKNMYNTESVFAGIDSFTKEATRICEPNGLILTLSYQIPKRIPNCDFIAVCGVYTIPSVSYMRCFTVSRKKVI
jgi:hypothetical protein